MRREHARYRAPAVSLFRRLDRFLLQPFWADGNEVSRHHVRLLSSLILVVTILGNGGTALFYTLNPDYGPFLQTWASRVLVSATGVLAIAYVLCRSGRYRWAAALFMVTLSVALLLHVAVPERGVHQVEMLPFLMLPVIVGSMFLSSGVNALFAAANLAAMLLLPAFVAEIPFSRLVGGVVPFFVMVSGAVLLGSHFRETMEEKRVQEKEQILEALRESEKSLRRRNRELALLNRVIAASAASLKPASILETACRELALAFDLPQAFACLLNEEKTERTIVAGYLAEGHVSVLDDTLAVENSPLVQYLITHKAPLIASDAQHDPRLASAHPLLREGEICSLLAIPLLLGEDVIGCLALVAFEPRDFSTEEVNLAWSVTDQAAGVLARARLFQDRRRLAAVIDQTDDGVTVTDTEGIILYVNPAFERITGYSQAEATGQHTRFLRSGEHDAALYEELWATIAIGQVWHGRLVNKRKDGTLCTVDTTISPVRNENGTIVNYVAIQRDVTRVLQLEAQYLQAQKMEAVGRLTAGIAHDFNNLLTAINGFAELARLQLLPDNPLHEMVEKILQSGQRAADLVRQLLAFSRRQIIEPQVLSLNIVMANMDKLLRRVIGEDIKLETRLASDLWAVKADPTQIEQVVANLAVNARDAMPGGGRLTIQTANVTLDEAYAAHHLEVEPGEYVLLTVSDTGVGMSEEVKAHLFEPFFTTKGLGKGTGLGLATVHGIVKQSGGHIWVYSEEGKGAVFRIYLPRHRGDIPKEAAVLRETVDLPAGDETILLVEDDERVRDLTRRILQDQGYTVLEARDGQEALAVSAAHPGDIHLLLTDIVMPGMSGRVVAERLSQTRPGLKVLFTSGYTDDETILRHGVPLTDVALLQKPFGAAALTGKVRQVLDGKRAL